MTIEEKARIAFPRIGDPADVLSRHGYVEGATEQRELDIQRACDAYCKVCKHFEICSSNCYYYHEFVKAMKGE